MQTIHINSLSLIHCFSRPRFHDLCTTQEVMNEASERESEP